MQWPRGKYNGQRIGGFRVQIIINILYWWWRPRWSWNFGEPYFLWLFLGVRANREFE